MSRIGYPGAATETPTLFEATSNLKIDLGNRWETWSTAQFDPSEWENAFWQVARLVEAACRDEAVRAAVAARMALSPDAALKAEFGKAQNMIRAAVEFHEQQADWFREQLSNLSKLSNALSGHAPAKGNPPEDWSA